MLGSAMHLQAAAFQISFKNSYLSKVLIYEYIGIVFLCLKCSIKRTFVACMSVDGPAVITMTTLYTSLRAPAADVSIVVRT